MKRILSFLLALCLLLGVAGLPSASAEGWIKSGSKWWYDNGDGTWPAGELRQINGKWYYFDDSGYMATGWKQIEGYWRYFSSGGAMVSNAWVKDSVGWCYLGEDGRMLTNTWKADSKGVCYLDGSGRMVKSKWILVDGDWYYMNGSGYRKQNGWAKDSVGWCYLGEDGRMLTNVWKKDSKGWCYLKDTGRMAINEWVKDGGAWYYLNGSGYMVTGWKKVGGVWYYFQDSGKMAANAWAKDTNGWRWMDENGRISKSRWVADGGKRYYIGANGYMVTGKTAIGDDYYFFKSGGAMQTGWIKDNALWYYADPDGKLVCGQSRVINGTEYWFSHEGVLLESPITPSEVYQAIIAQKQNYPEGMRWTNANRYEWPQTVFPDTYYVGYGCLAFAMIMSDAAFGDLEGRRLTRFRYSDLQVGDILRVDDDSHSVIILEVHEDYLVIAEGNYNNSVHWGRHLSRADAEAATYLITRYP
ncbi:MAG: hypothetical protein IJ179_03830 [Oscillospiraceae bacterium]|nr:hypothetical protein [Oscillospiraceae bacterium]